jgi:hypothetical protein
MPNGGTRATPCFNLPRHEVEVLITGYSIKMRSAVLHRLYELESQRAAGTRSWLRH